MWLKAALLIGVALVVAQMIYNASQRVAPAEARSLVEGDGALLVDVRTTAEYRQGHLPNAINIPVHELMSRLGELGPKDRKVVVYCHSGARSARAARQLKKAGFQNVHDLGGMNRWR